MKKRNLRGEIYLASGMTSGVSGYFNEKIPKKAGRIKNTGERNRFSLGLYAIDSPGVI